MSDPTVNTVRLHALVDRIQAGDLAARDELLHGVCNRLERLARKMLRRFPGVRRWAQTDDVLQNALLRLLRALQQVRPDSTRSFFNLAAEQMRRELLDMARHFFGPHGHAAHYASGVLAEDGAAPAADPPDRAEAPGDLERWCRFHEEVEKLPAEEREVVGLIYYHGWAQAAVAELFQVNVRTVQRRWQAAMLKLHEYLNN